jgi:hypothetical protein
MTEGRSLGSPDKPRLRGVAGAVIYQRNKSMIPKSGCRLSEKIMLKK